MNQLNFEQYYQFDYQNKNQIKEEQLKLLHQQITYTISNSPFYKNKWKDFPINSPTWYEAFKKMPLTRKEDIQNQNDDFIAVSNALIRDITSTSGSEGAPIYIYQTQRDIERLALNEALSFSKLALDSHPRIQLMLTLDKLFMAGMAYYQGGLSQQGQLIRSGPGQTYKQIELLKKFQPDVVVAVPSFLLYILQSEDVSSYFQEKPLKVLAIGENLRTGNGEALPLLKQLEALDFVEVYSTYASTEMQTAFTECAEKNGNHQQSALIFMECLDEYGNDADEGELVISHLGIEGFPLLRYATGDMISTDKSECPCGRNTPRIKSVLYRKNQRLKIKGTTLYPADIDPIFQQFNLQQSYYIEIFKNDFGLDDLKIFVDSAIFDESLLKKVRERLQHSLKLRPNLIIQDTLEFHRRLFKDESRKPLKIQDLRNI